MIANDRPFLITFEGHLYFPAFVTYPETAFGGDFETAADFRDRLTAEADRGQGLAHRVAAHPLFLRYPQPRPADARAIEADLAGEQGGSAKDVVQESISRVVAICSRQLARDRRSGPRCRRAHSYAIPHLGAVRALLDRLCRRSSAIAVGGHHGYFGGWRISFQRFLEVWTAVPSLYLLLKSSRQRMVPGFFVPAQNPAAVLWVSLVGLGARRIPAVAATSEYARSRAGAGSLERDHHAPTSCRMPWSRP